MGDYLIFCASSKERERVFWRTKDPMSDEFEPCCEPQFYFFDPAMFTDDDGRVYLYWGCDCGVPLYGIELDSKTLMPIGEEVVTIRGDFKNHGWERREYPGKPVKPLTPEQMYIVHFYIEIGQGVCYTDDGK